MNLYQTLFPWQKNVVDKYKDKNNFGLFIDMGLGKTILSLAFAEVNKCDKVLIVTLNSKALEPETKSDSWLGWATHSDIKYDFKNKWSEVFDQSRPELLIINYESLFERGKNKRERVTIKEVIQKFIASCKGHNVAIIADESHKLKDLQSQQTAALNKIQKELSRVSSNIYTYLLTGTPFTTGYIDLYSQLKLLGLDINKGEFTDRYCVRGNIPGLLGWQQPIVGYKNVEDLFNLIHRYALTIKSEEVAKNLPPQVFIEHKLPMSLDFDIFTKERAYPEDIDATFARHNLTPDKDYKSMPHKLVNNPFSRNIAAPDEKWWATTSGTYWLRARELSIGFQGSADDAQWFDRNRLTEIEKFLADNPNNYLLFYNYTPELIELYDICERLGYNIDVYCGEAKSLIFYDKYEKQTDAQRLTNTKNIILANFASGSTGMNWQAYHNCIIFSCPLYKDYEQGIKRIHRTGQKETTFYHRFYQDNFLDKGMNDALAKQINYSKDMFESDLQRVKMLTSENNSD